MVTRWLFKGLVLSLLLAAPLGCGKSDTEAEGVESQGVDAEDLSYPTKQMTHIRPNAANAAIVREFLASNTDSAAAAGPVQVVSNDGWVDMTGVVRIQGDPPPQLPVDVTKDQQVCAPGGQAVLDGSMVVGSDNGLGNVLIFVTSDVSEDWEHEQHKATVGAELTGEEAFDQKNCVFQPHVFAMRASQKLQVLNSDPIGHNTNIGEFGFNVTIGANDSTFFEPGREKRTPFQVRCSIHPWMQGWMITRGNPYFAVTDADGRFTIPKVPAGVELEFTVWHERSPGPKFTVDGTPESRKFARTLAKDSAPEFQLVIDASEFKN